MLETPDEFRAFFDGAPDVFYVQDLRGRLRRVNKAFETLTGYQGPEALAMNMFDLVAPEYHDRIIENTFATCGGAPPRPFELEILTKTAGRVHIEICTQLLFRDGRPVGIHGFARDISQLKRDLQERALTESKLIEKTSQLASFTRYLQLLHRLSTKNHQHLDELFADYLAAGTEVFELAGGAILQTEDGRLTVRKVHGNLPDAPAAIESIVNSAAIETPIVVDDVRFGCILFWRDESGRSSGLTPYAREIIEMMAKAIGSAIRQRQLTDMLAYQAKHDALTELPNRLMLADRLEAALERARKTGAKVAVLFIDLDMFKQINDTLGHAVGDGVLQQVARRLSACMASGDALARMGGDEFTAILTNIRDEAEAVAYARTLLAAVRTPCRVQEYELFVTASVGISLYPSDGDDSATLLRNADAAMYSAKYRGKNDVHCYRAEVTASALQRFELETHLRRALERDELRMLYQPQVDLDGKLAGVEVLLAWDHPELGRIPPVQFIPIAEETGMILPIGAWVLDSACRAMAAWHRELGVSIPIAVNVSALQFSQGNLLESIASALAGSGLGADRLELELTESLVMRDVEQSAAVLQELRALGVRVAIDDFGTGYSSLSYLRRLPADALKIDQSFVSEIEDEGSGFALVNAIAVLGHTFGLQVTAEGIETKRQFELVRRAGCDRVQGHLFGGPVTHAEMEVLLRRSLT